jgi:peptidoglycan/xylan/chitin deacetylase (PgdA/CDA1 family)
MNSAKRQLIDAVVRLATVPPLPAWSRRMHRKPVCILMLHGFTDCPNPSGIGNTEGIHMPIQDFEAICRLLASDYHVVSLDRVIESLDTGEPLPPNPVVLTFDDGYLSNYELAFPVLRRHGLPGTIFATTNFVDGRQWMWWDRLEYALGHTPLASARLTVGASFVPCSLRDREERREAFRHLLPLVKALPQEDVDATVSEVEQALRCSLAACSRPPRIYLPFDWDQAREMTASGLVAIGGHTHTHLILGRCRPETARGELLRSKERLHHELGAEAPHFAYPNGHGDSGDHTPWTRDLVIAAGYRSALTTDLGRNAADADRFRLRRFGTGNTPAYTDAMASGLLGLLVSLKQAVAPIRRAA